MPGRLPQRVGRCQHTPKVKKRGGTIDLACKAANLEPRRLKYFLGKIKIKGTLATNEWHF